jgi:hypothetical protein
MDLTVTSPSSILSDDSVYDVQSITLLTLTLKLSAQSTPIAKLSAPSKRFHIAMEENLTSLTETIQKQVPSE